TLPPPFGLPEPRRNPNLNDVALQIAPWNEAVRDAWRSGSLPWLDRWNGCGMALAANGQSAAFSPFTLAGLPLPLGRAFTLAEALKLLLALCGTWLWLSELRVSRAAALAGALAFGFSLSMTVWLPWPIASVIALWPWALFLLERLDDPAGRGRAAAGLVAVLIGWAAAGHPESAAVGAAFALLWTAFRLASRSWANPAAVVGTAAFAAIVAAGLSGPLLVPQLAAIRASARSADVRRIAAGALSSWKPRGPGWMPGFVTPFFPRAYGDGVEAPLLARAGGSFPEVSSAYAGAAAWVLVLLVLRPGSRRRAETVGFVAIGAAAAVEAAWSWPAVGIVARLPGLGSISPVRFHGWIPLCVAALAALEFDRWKEDLRTGRRAGFWLAGAALAFGAAAYAVFRHLRGAYLAVGSLETEKAGLRSLAAVLAAVAAAGVIAALARVRPGIRAGIAAAALAAAIGGELFAIARPLARFGLSSAVFPETPLVSFLRRQPGVFRTAGIGTAMFPNANVFARVEDVRTNDPLERRDYVAFLDAAAGYPPAAYFKTLGDPDAAVFDFLNVEYVIGPPGASRPGARWTAVYSGADGTVFRNGAVLARVFAPDEIVSSAPALPGHPEDAFAAFGRSANDVVREIDGGRRALVVADEGAPLPSAAGSSPRPRISTIREDRNSLSFVADLAGRAPRVVLASEVQDGGWRARDELGRLPTGRANGPFLAVGVRPGRHRVTLSYAPPGLRTGIVAAAAAALLAAGALLRRRPAATR
ncbi:MAG TPA: hypothetical protein VG777_07395, partial [Thermoanaerobaculia bacterium]|nr:hypothetical protein [Thermoanaerobaculia bacterium]